MKAEIRKQKVLPSTQQVPDTLKVLAKSVQSG